MDRTQAWQDGWDYADCADMDGEPYDPNMEPGHLSNAEREIFIAGYEAWHAANNMAKVFAEFSSPPPEAEATPRNAALSERCFSVATENRLRNMGIDTLAELTAKSAPELLRGPNLGRKSLNEITEVLSAMGLSLRKH